MSLTYNRLSRNVKSAGSGRQPAGHLYYCLTMIFPIRYLARVRQLQSPSAIFQQAAQGPDVIVYLGVPSFAPPDG